MSLQQTLPAKFSANGLLGELERRGQLDGKMQLGKLQTNLIGAKAGVVGSPARDRLLYTLASLIGLHVEVSVQNGSIYSGIFHSTNTEKDFGIILKMARTSNDDSPQEEKPIFSTSARPQTIIIPSVELVQIVAKDVPLAGDDFCNGHLHDKQQDLMIDSAIAFSHLTEERELERWIPDNDGPLYHELEDIFDGSRNRKWDQFETNEVLFGVKSTFNEELYTTKLERGPQTRELEREAQRIAREIEGEERGFELDEDYELDEETRFSAVYRGVPDDHYENVHMVFHSKESLQRVSDTSAGKKPSDVSEKESCNSEPAHGSCQQMNNQHAFEGVHGPSSKEENRFLRTNIPTLEEGNKVEQKNIVVPNETLGPTGAQTSSRFSSKSYNHQDNSPLDAEVYCADESKDLLTETLTPVGVQVSAQPVRSSSRPSSSRSSSSDHVGGSSASSGPGLSPGSSVGSLSSEKSKLNPYAKEFKWNPNAQSFTPPSSLRPHSPVSENSFYYPANVSAVPHVRGLPVGVGIGSPYGVHQPVVYNPHAIQIQTPPAYVHPGGPYGQQMYFAPRPVVYMPTYPPEMRRDY